MAGEIFEHRDSSCELIVILHGLCGSPKAMQAVMDAARAARPNADIVVPSLAFGGFFFGFFAFKAAETIAAGIVLRIQAAIDDRKRKHLTEYEKIILVGHSFGAVIARKVAIIAHGEIRDGDGHLKAAFEDTLEHFRPARSWAFAIERIVMLAAVNRGWSPDSARAWWLSTLWSIGSLFGEITALVTPRGPTVLSFRQGMPFIIQTRLQWLALASSLEVVESRRRFHQDRQPHARRAVADEGHRIPLIQLLGTTDDLVAPDDSVDTAVDSANGAKAITIDLPLSGHRQTLAMSQPTAVQEQAIHAGIAEGALADRCKRDGLAAQVRWHLFSRALSDSTSQLEDVATNPQFLLDMTPIPPDNATDVVFVIHGIRDHGFWTQKIAAAIKKEAAGSAGGGTFRSFTSSYGYFAILPFVLPWVRRWKAAWLMDHYTEVKARCPNAKFSYVGHSNGTYLLARVLEDYAAARFERVVFAGSVVRRDFPWHRYLHHTHHDPVPRVRAVLNYVATADWVVAILSKAFQPARRLFDIGSAGHDGFEELRGNRLMLSSRLLDFFLGRSPPRPVALKEAHYIIGNHSAGISETQWDDIARFIVNETVPPKGKDPDFQAHRSAWMIAFSWFSPLWLILGFWIVVGTGVGLYESITGEGTVRFPWIERYLEVGRDSIESLGHLLLASIRNSAVYPLWTRVVDTVARGIGALPDSVGSLLSCILGIVSSASTWVWHAVWGEIHTFRAGPGTPDGAKFRAGVFAAYIFAVYLFVTRF